MLPPERKWTPHVSAQERILHPVRVERANPRYARMLQEQLGGANGELKAAMQYLSQSFRIQNPEIKDLFLDIASEELSPHGNGRPDHFHAQRAYAGRGACGGRTGDPCMLGLSPGLMNASGYSWTADYVSVTGDLCADLLSNIASEQRAKVMYEYLYRQIDDKYVKETIDFLLNREEAHNALFREASTRCATPDPTSALA